jgi:glutamate-1-semialdehyde 2,1-aminomutase
MNHTESAALFERNARYIPGGTVSLNRKVEPEIAFVRGQGAYLWDVDGNRYVDYHAGFAPYLLGHADPNVEGAVAGGDEGRLDPGRVRYDPLGGARPPNS